MSSDQIDVLLDIFSKKNLAFQPDFDNVDPSKHYQAGETIQSKAKNELELSRKWRSFNEDGSPSPHYVDNRPYLKDYLKNYKTRGVDFLESSILSIMSNGAKEKREEPLLGLRNFFKLTTEPEQELMEKFANIFWFAVPDEDLLEMPVIYRCVGDLMSITLSQGVCATLLAWMFFDTTKNRSFLEILTSTHPISIEKIKFLLNYFSQVREHLPSGNVSFLRIKNSNFMEEKVENSKKRDKKLADLTIRNDSLIEQTALCTQVDFANKHIGGGVLRLGGVQEEIRFLMCPEMLVSMLLFNKMEPDEAISIVGAQVYSSYTGYSGKLKWRDLQPSDALQNQFRDKYGRIHTECLAINAQKFFGRPSRNLSTQLGEQNIRKEVMKAGVGFSAHGPDFKYVPIFSGWWGCGAYSGNKPLKFLIQLLAASIADRPLHFCTFGESALGNKCNQMKRRLDMDGVTVGELYDLLLKVPTLEEYDETHVFKSIEEMLCQKGAK